MALHLLFDIGGTKMRFATSEDGIHMGSVTVVENPGKYEEALQIISDVTSKLAGGETFSSGTGGVAGVLSKDKHLLVSSPHLLDWQNKDVLMDLEKIIGGKVSLQNDSAMVGLGEAVFGSGKGFEIVAYITVSTGVGGVRIVGGHIDKASRGFEPGHQIIDYSGSVDPRFNVNGSLEEFVSGTAITRRTGLRPQDISPQDPLWDSLAEILAFGVYNSTLHWSPDVVVLGGSMIVGSPAIEISAVIRYIKEINRVYDTFPPIKKAALLDVGGLHGALAYLKQQL